MNPSNCNISPVNPVGPVNKNQLPIVWGAQPCIKPEFTSKIAQLYSTWAIKDTVIIPSHYTTWLIGVPTLGCFNYPQ